MSAPPVPRPISPEKQAWLKRHRLFRSKEDKAASDKLKKAKADYEKLLPDVEKTLRDALSYAPTDDYAPLRAQVDEAAQLAADDEYVEAHALLLKVDEGIDTTLEPLREKSEAFNKKALKMMTLISDLAGYVNVETESEKEQKRRQEALEEIQGDFRDAENAAAEKDWVLAQQLLDKVDDILKSDRAQLNEIVNLSKKRGEVFKGMTTLQACEDLLRSISARKKVLLTEKGTPEKYIRDAVEKPSEAETAYASLREEFNQLWKAAAGDALQPLADRFDPRFGRRQKTLQAFLDELSSPSPTTDAFLDEAVAGVKEKVDNEQLYVKALENASKAAGTWQKAYRTVGDFLSKLEAMGTGDQLDFATWKAESQTEDIKKLATPPVDVRIAKAKKEAGEDTKAFLKALTEIAGAYLSAAQELRDQAQRAGDKLTELAEERATRRGDVLTKYKETLTMIQAARKNRRESVDKEFFDGLNKRRQELKPLIESSENKAALDHAEAELKKIQEACAAGTKGAPDPNPFKEAQDKHNVIRTKLSLETGNPRLYCKGKLQELGKRFKKLETDLYSKGPDDPGVIAELKALAEAADAMHVDADGIAERVAVFETDKATTQGLLDATIVEIAKQLAPEKFTGAQLKKRLATLVAQHPSERLGDYESMIKGMRELRAELRAGAGNAYADLLDFEKKQDDEDQEKADQKIAFDTALGEFEAGDYKKARGLLENWLTRKLSKAHLKKRNARALNLSNMYDQCKKMAKEGNYEEATNRLGYAKKMATAIIEMPEGPKPTPKSDFEKLGKKWKDAVKAFSGRLDDVAGKITAGGEAIATAEPAQDGMRAAGKKVADALLTIKDVFKPAEFDTWLRLLAGDDEPARKKAKEDALRSVRKYQRILREDPLVAKLRENPFQGVNVREVFLALEDLELNVVRA